MHSACCTTGSGGSPFAWPSGSSETALAEDAVQEAFLAVWRSADAYKRERAKPSTWILTVVHRRAVDIVRREQTRRGEPLEVAPEPVSGPADEDAVLRTGAPRCRRR